MVVLGIAQEHHADRCLLFAQWRDLDFIILHDPINLIGTKVVPLFVAIDEQGIVRALQPDLDDFEMSFLDQDFEGGEPGIEETVKPLIPDIDDLQRRALKDDSSVAWRALGDALVLWYGSARISEAIAAYTHALQMNLDDSAVMFRLGVSYSFRHESDQRQTGDFQKAVGLWSDALARDPGQYIWRRRIQQYGSRMDKPYPFYNWINQAQAEIRKRGQVPVEIRVALTESETAQPAKAFFSTEERDISPDPQGLIPRDEQGFIKAEVTVIPPRIPPGGGVRIHIVFRPDDALDVHWNNEAEPLRVWLDLPEGWRSDGRLRAAPQPREPESREIRMFDFDLLLPRNAKPGPVRLAVYALYYACEGEKGTCFFLRQDIPIAFEIKE